MYVLIQNKMRIFSVFLYDSLDQFLISLMNFQTKALKECDISKSLIISDKSYEHKKAKYSHFEQFYNKSNLVTKFGKSSPNLELLQFFG